MTAGSITPLPQRVAALWQHPRSGTVKELQGFLGTVNFYRRFICRATHLLRSPHRRPLPQPVSLWTHEMQQSFQAAREALACRVELVHPCLRAALSLSVDASADHVGAVLQQRPSPVAPWQPLGFFS